VVNVPGSAPIDDEDDVAGKFRGLVNEFKLSGTAGVLQRAIGCMAQDEAPRRHRRQVKWGWVER
jgi:hypothetical protein